MPDSVFTRSLRLPSGASIRLRLARPNDAEAIQRLAGLSALDARRLLRFDPARRAVLCALDTTETLVGVGAIDLHQDAEPDLIAAELAGLADLLAEVLRRRADSHGRRVA